MTGFKLFRALPAATVYGFALGPVKVNATSRSHRLSPGMYFCAPTPVIVEGDALAVSRFGYTGLFLLGGPIEERGRLRYIDGCTDTLLLPPPRRGDPCLNHLHFPKRIRQTMHTHPSVRLGVVARGSGRCETPDAAFPLVPGVGWALPADWPHAFHTGGESMDVIAFHPETDTGPADDDHPMLNRTLVGGVSARHLPQIRTGAVA
jgi:quercetin dioxygenase-like cupin family protein